MEENWGFAGSSLEHARGWFRPGFQAKHMQIPTACKRDEDFF